MAHLDANSRGLHTINMISLCSNMTQYYVQVDDIPQFIIMMEDAQKKTKQAGMPIANVELVMMALAAVLTAQHFPQEVDDWEGLLAICHTWRALKTAFHLAHPKRQRQLQESGRGGPLGSAHVVLPAPDATINRLGAAQQPGPSGGQQHHSSPAADVVELGSHHVGHHAHHGQQETCGGTSQGKANQPSGGNAGNA
jgi:hypothetical protein